MNIKMQTLVRRLKKTKDAIEYLRKICKHPNKLIRVREYYIDTYADGGKKYRYREYLCKDCGKLWESKEREIK